VPMEIFYASICCVPGDTSDGHVVANNLSSLNRLAQLLRKQSITWSVSSVEMPAATNSE
jgi:hypothetical protein